MAEIAADQLRHDRISPPLYFGMVAAGRIALDRACGDPAPDADDPRRLRPDRRPGELVASSSKGLAPRTRRLKVYPEMRHEPLNEIGRDAVIADLASWLEPRVKPRA